MVRARLRDHLPTMNRQYRRHVPGQGRAYRLRGIEVQHDLGSEPRNGGRRNKGCSPTRAGRQSGATLVSIAAAIELREGRERTVSESTTGELDSSFAASTASTRRTGDRDGGGQEDEGVSNYTEEEGGSYTEEGTLEEFGSSIGGGKGESLLSGPGELMLLLFQLLHQRWHPSRRNRLPPLRLRRTGRVSALRAGGTGGRETQTQGKESRATSLALTEGREAIQEGGRGGWGGQCRSPWIVLCMTRGCTDGTGPWPTLEP